MKDHKEIRGELRDISESKDSLTLDFVCTNIKTATIPKGSVNDTIHSLIGKKIGIINLYGKYYIRQIKEGNE